MTARGFARGSSGCPHEGWSTGPYSYGERDGRSGGRIENRHRGADPDVEDDQREQDVFQHSGGRALRAVRKWPRRCLPSARVGSCHSFQLGERCLSLEQCPGDGNGRETLYLIRPADAAGGRPADDAHPAEDAYDHRRWFGDASQRAGLALFDTQLDRDKLGAGCDCLVFLALAGCSWLA